MVVFGMFIDVHASVRLCLLLVHNLSLSGVSTKQIFKEAESVPAEKSKLTKHEICQTRTYLLLPERHTKCNIKLPCVSAEQQ
jgi:hypothetical protein